MKKRTAALLSAGTLAVTAALAAGLNQKLGLTTFALREENPLRLLLLTDFHATQYGQKQEEILALIESASPDVILLGGDFFDQRRKTEPVWELVRGIVPLAPVYFTSGNHDEHFRTRRHQFAKLRALGVHLLHEKTVPIEARGRRITLSGVPDIARLNARSASRYRSVFTPFSLLNKEDYNVLLAHRPEFLRLYGDYPFDLVLCGHVHGGQARIPFTGRGLIAPGQGLLPKWSGGRYEENGQTLIVSRGLSRFAHLPRIFNPPELVLILV